MPDTEACDRAARNVLRECFGAALDAVRAGPAVLRHLPPKPAGRCIVVGSGKATAAMAAAVDAAWPDVNLSGVVSTRYGHSVPAGRVQVIEACHPVPDENSVRAAKAMFAAVSGLNENDLVLACVSGGGSASLALPAIGLDLAQKQAITRSLLASGAPIAAINTVRRHISAIKGGRLAVAASPAQVFTLLISDIPGDDPAAIASGPTLADATCPADALRIIDQYQIPIPGPLRIHLAHGNQSPDPTGNGDARLVATPAQALAAAALRAGQLGVCPVVLGDALEGESALLGHQMAQEALDRGASGTGGKPLILLSGGETTVTIGPQGSGKGGRNTEFLLALAVALQGQPGIWAIAADTDGIDGSEDAAGALVAPDTLVRARALGLQPDAMLLAHDSYNLFAATDDLLVTGPTFTNVNDFRAILIIPQKAKP